MSAAFLRATGVALVLLASTPVLAQDAVDEIEDDAETAVVTATTTDDDEGGFDLGWLGLLGLFGLMGLRGRRDHVITSTNR